MYAKYQTLINLPKPLLAAMGVGAILAVWGVGRFSLSTLAVLFIYLALVLLVAPLTRWLVRCGVRPNQVTVAGAVVSVIAFWPLAAGRLQLGLLLVIAGGLADGLDGYLARQSNEISQRGGFLDSVLDRVADAALLIGLSLYFHGQGRPLWAGLALAGLAGAFLVSYVRAKAEQSLAGCEVGLGGERPDRLIALTISGLAGYLELGVLYVIATSWLTAARRFHYAWRELDE